MTFDTWAAVLVTGVGLAIGSFLNVCIWRLPALVVDQEPDQHVGRLRAVLDWQVTVWSGVFRGLAVLSSPPSSCPRCHARIAWYHNVPVVSWLVLRGRCASCGAPISCRYPIVETLTALIFLMHLGSFDWGPLLFVRLAFAAAMIVLFAIDLDHQLLPDVITVPGAVIGLVASVFLPPGFRNAVVGALVGGGVLWVVAEAYYRIRGVDGLGFGDVKMLAMIGTFLGWQGVLVTLLLGSFSGALVGVALIVSGRAGMSVRLPFGTFLATGAIVASLWGDALVNWYLSFFPR